MIDINQLPHISSLTTIESNFRVFAGPGSGKTSWLINHLQTVLRESKRLGKTRRIACITYTNVAVEEIQSRLHGDKSRFDISTIHSFLYRNIIKPFRHLIATNVNGEHLFNIDHLSGHEQHIPHRDRIRRWLKSVELTEDRYENMAHPRNAINLIESLSNLGYFIINEEIVLGLRKHPSTYIPRDKDQLWLYKAKYWQDGIMHHEDVLYFSYLILQKSPQVVDFIRRKYPYIFIDEFQDTTVLQTWIIKKIAEQETKVGVIGDLAQSIYKFAGAKRTDFEDLTLKDILSYKLEINYRSTKKVVQFLNFLRTDITQVSAPNAQDGESVCILIGSVHKAMDWVTLNEHQQTFFLSKNNEDVALMVNKKSIKGANYLHRLYASDSNTLRAKAIHSILMGYKLYKKKRLKEALEEVLKPLIKVNTSLPLLTLRKEAIQLLFELEKNLTRQKTLFQYYEELALFFKNRYDIKIGAALTIGAAKKFYKRTTLNKLLPHIKIDTQSNEQIRTIHSTKGTEFDSVFIYFPELSEFESCVLNAPNQLYNSLDDARVYYVGLSRAKRRLFINIPASSPQVEQKAAEWGIRCIDIS